MSITRERLLEIIVTGPEASGAEQNELARMALAAMGRESGRLPLDYLQGHKDGLEWAAKLAEANHPETGDWLYDDPIELAKAIRKGPDMPPVQPAADSEPVAWLLSGGGAKNVVCFDSGNAYADPLREVTPLYHHAQLVPVSVPDEIQKLKDGRGFRYVKDGVHYSVNYASGWNQCRAAMLAAAPKSPGGDHAAVPGKWIPVSERMPDENEEQQVLACFKGGDISTVYYFEGRWDDAYGIVQIRQDVTHWMPLPASPQEVEE